MMSLKTVRILLRTLGVVLIIAAGVVALGPEAWGQPPPGMGPCLYLNGSSQCDAGCAMGSAPCNVHSCKAFLPDCILCVCDDDALMMGSCKCK
jgi:hypothetical protein